MSGYLLDTNVISLFAPDKPPVSSETQNWIREQSAKDGLYLSAVTIAEIQRGIRKLQRKSADVKAGKIEQWFGELTRQFDSRILPVDAKVAMAAGTIEEQAESKGHRQGLADVLIAATALVHGLTIVTLNVRHFASLGVPFTSPDDLQNV